MTTAHFTLHAQRLLGAGKTGDAISLLEEGLKQFPEYASAYALLARAYLQMQDVTTAYEVALNAVQRFPYHRGLQLLRRQIEELLRSPSTPQAPTSAAATSPEPESASTEPAAPEAATTIPEEVAAGEDVASESSSPTIEQIETVEAQPPAPTEPEQQPEPPAAHAAAVGSTATEAPSHSLRIVETATIDKRAMRMLRSSNIRLIPGLEFAPLRIEPTRTTSKPTAIEFPPFRPIRGSLRQSARLRPVVPTTPAELEAELQARHGTPPPAQKTSLELLAERLERARIKTPEQSEPLATERAEDTDEPAMVTETIARIYERQGAIDQAIKAYMILARQHPERRAYYEEKIAHLRSKQR